MLPTSRNKTELLVGIFIFCGLALLAGLVLKFGDFKYWFRDKYKLSVVFADAGNVVRNSPVRRGGVEIGRVTKDPELVQGISGVRVPLVIYKNYHVGADSTFQIKFDGIIGDTFIEVTPSPQPSGVMLKDGDEVKGTVGGGLNSLSDTANLAAEKIVVVLEDIRGSLLDLKEAIKTVRTGVLSDENVAAFSHSLKELNTSLEKIDTQVLSEANTTALKDGIQKFGTTLEKIGGTFENADQAIASADRAITSKLNPGLDEFKSAATTFRKMSEGFNGVAGDMRGGQGLLQALLKDKTVRDDFARLMSNLRRHGMLWYKDDAALPGDPPPPKRKGLFGD